MSSAGAERCTASSCLHADEMILTRADHVFERGSRFFGVVQGPCWLRSTPTPAGQGEPYGFVVERSAGGAFPSAGRAAEPEGTELMSEQIERRNPVWNTAVGRTMNRILVGREPGGSIREVIALARSQGYRAGVARERLDRVAAAGITRGSSR